MKILQETLATHNCEASAAEDRYHSPERSTNLKAK